MRLSVDDVRLAGAPACSNVFDRFGHEHNLVGLCTLVDVVVHEPFVVE